MERFVSLSVIAAAVALGQPLQAQNADSYRFDIGVHAGMSGYLGDASQSNLYSHPGFAGGLSGRYLFDDRWSVRGRIGIQTLSGNTADMDDALPGGRNLKFNSSVYDATLTAEFNFFAFGIGQPFRRLKRWTPYVSAGIGAAMSRSGSDSSGAFVLPLGLGARYKFSPRVNLMAEFSMTKAFGDHMDSRELADLQQIKSSFIKNTDWYSTFTVGLSYEIGPRCAECHRID